MNLIFTFIQSFIQQAVSLLLDIAKIEIATFYVGTVKNLRRIFVLGLCVFLGAMLCFSGFLIIHIALFIYLPWSIPVKSLFLLGLGLVYFTVPLCLVLIFSTQRYWMKISQADKLIDGLKNK